ncbi:hypothetical protein QCA50_018651 [Cerrena zonata]|uniref:Cytochrome P450 n=1 Tax=Cerrena zonata TaxID=2478898 RepID=A0AAW0FL37_9APHY
MSGMAMWCASVSLSESLYMSTQSWKFLYTGPNELSFRRKDIIEPILSNKELHKGPYYDLRQVPARNPVDGIKDYREHAARRRLWSRGTSVSMTKIYTQSLIVGIHELLDELLKRQDTTIDISEWLSFTATDFMGRMTFSTSFDMVKMGYDSVGIIKPVEEITYQSNIIAQTPWIIPYLMWLPQGKKALNQGHRLGGDMVRKRKALGTDTRDLYYYLMDEAGFENVKPRETDVLSDGITAIAAGSDTTATAITNTLYYLLKHPDVKTRLQRDIREAFSSSREVYDYAKSVKLPFLDACINESLRLLPPGLTGFQRQVDPSGRGKMLGEHFVPPGTNVYAHLYSIQRDPRYFSPLPEIFWPDRWLDQNTYTLPTGESISKDALMLSRDAYYPFSIGQQSCAGRNIALLELKTLLIAILRHFDIQVAEGYQLDGYEEALKDVHVTLRGPLCVRLHSVATWMIKTCQATSYQARNRTDFQSREQ